jgi:hypothetical protein
MNCPMIRTVFGLPITLMLLGTPVGCTVPLATLQVMPTDGVQQIARHGLYYGVSKQNGVTCALSAELNEFSSDDNSIYMNVRIVNDSSKPILIRPADLELFYRQDGRWHAATVMTPRQLKADLVNVYKRARQGAIGTRSENAEYGYIEPASTTYTTNIRMNRKRIDGNAPTASRHVSSEETIETEGLRGFERTVTKAKKNLRTGKLEILDDHTLLPGQSINGAIVADGRVGYLLMGDLSISTLFQSDSGDREDRDTNGDYRILFRIDGKLHEFRLRLTKEHDRKQI